MALREFTIAELQDAYAAGEASVVEVCSGYLRRIDEIDRSGPTLRSVIEINPDALEIAAELDAERKAHGPRSRLHGVVVLLKDNIDTADKMMTTAGSLALEGHYAPRDAFLVERLRAAGAVILGKTNMSEWAYFRSSRGCSGWSSRGGQVRNPHVLDRNPSGSSSGSAVAVAANLCTVAIGTETDGSIVSPSSMNGIVGIKPTLGLVSRSGVVPIAHSQDTAGPMARTVADAATVLDVLAGTDVRDAATHGTDDQAKAAYAGVVDEDSLRGVRLGVARHYFGRHEGADAVAQAALDVLRSLGATLVDPVDLGTLGFFVKPEFEVLLYEFKSDLNRYLAEHPSAPVRTLEDVIAFNDAHADRVMPYFGQELLQLAQGKGDLTEPAYLAARDECLRLSRTEGIDKAMADHQLDAIIAPTESPPWVTDPVMGDKNTGGCSSPAAIAGYPHVTVPAGHVHGLPVGLSFFGGAYTEARLIAYAAAFESATSARRAPALQPSLDG